MTHDNLPALPTPDPIKEGIEAAHRRANRPPAERWVENAVMSFTVAKLQGDRPVFVLDEVHSILSE